MQPIHQQGTQPGIVQLQLVGQPGQAALGFGGARCGQAVKREFGRWCTAAAGVQKAAHHVEPRHFQRAQALAQRGLQCVFPALFNVDTAPQALQTFETVARKPGCQFAVGLDLFLQRLQCFHTGRQLGLFAAVGIHRLLFGAAVFVQLGHRVLQLVQAGFGHAGQLLCLVQQRLLVSQTGLVRCGQRVAVGTQAFAALVELARLFFNATLLGGQHLDLLLHLHNTSALGVGFGLGLP